MKGHTGEAELPSHRELLQTPGAAQMHTPWCWLCRLHVVCSCRSLCTCVCLEHSGFGLPPTALPPTSASHGQPLAEPCWRGKSSPQASSLLCAGWSIEKEVWVNKIPRHDGPLWVEMQHPLSWAFSDVYVAPWCVMLVKSSTKLDILPNLPSREKEEYREQV